MYMYRYRRNLDLLYQTPEELPVDLSPPKNHLKIIIRKAKRKRQNSLTQADVDRFLDAYDIPRAKGKLAKDADQALMTAAEVRLPSCSEDSIPRHTAQDRRGRSHHGNRKLRNSQRTIQIASGKMKKAKPDAKESRESTFRRC